MRGIVSPLSSVPWEHLSPRSSQGATVRRGLALIIAWGGIAVVFVVAGVVAVGSDLIGGAAGVLVALALALCGLVWWRRPWGPWLSLGAILTVVVLGALSPGTRFDVLVMGTYTVTFLAIFVTSRRWGLLAVCLGTVAMTVVATRSDVRVVVADVAVNVGYVAVLQMIVAGVWLWWAWHSSLDQAARRDAIAVEQEHAIEASLALQERTRAWREAITRTHETILNDLRYVLRTPEVDRARLADQLLTTRDRRSEPPSDPGALAERLRGDFAGEVLVVDHTREAGAPWAAQVQPILLEIVRNVARHTDARHVRIVAERHGGNYVITVEDDGSGDASHANEAQPGIGRSVVVEESLGALGGRLERSAHRCRIELPRGRRSAGTGGRVLLALLSIVLASSALGGSIQFVMLLAGASTAYAVVAAAALLLTAVSVITVVRGRLVGWSTLVPATILAAIVPWGMALAPQTCALPSLMLTTINLSLNAFFATLLWARSRWAWLLVLPPFAGVGALSLEPGLACPLQAGDVLLSSAVLVPILMTVSWLSTRSAARWDEQDRQRWETEIAERARAEVDVDLARALDDSVDLAWSLMWEVAQGADLDDERRRSLRTADSMIRSSLQVDPRTAGGMVLAAREIVARVAADGTPLHVRSLRGSTDPRPLGRDLVDALVGVVAQAAGADISIHVFTDEHDDYLTITAPAVAAARSGFVPGWDDNRGGCLVEVEYVGDHPDTAAEVTLIVSRPIQSSEAADPAQVAVVG